MRGSAECIPPLLFECGGNFRIFYARELVRRLTRQIASAALIAAVISWIESGFCALKQERFDNASKLIYRRYAPIAV